MSRFLILPSLLLVAQAQAGIDIQLGRGGWTCAAEGIQKHPTISRGTSRIQAEHNAKQACAAIEGSEFHCRIEKCEQDKNSRNNRIDINFAILRSGNSISIKLNQGHSAAICRSKAFTKTYIAEAPTLLEAQTLSRQTCIQDGNHGMHCKVKDCETLGNSDQVEIKTGKDRFNLKGKIKDIFK